MAQAKIELVFFESVSGNQHVLEWLKMLPRVERLAIGQDLLRVQFRWPVGMPLVRNLSNGLWEVRSTLPSNRVARVIFCTHDGELVALHGFIKKSQATPQGDLDLALKRKRTLT